MKPFAYLASVMATYRPAGGGKVAPEDNPARSGQLWGLLLTAVLTVGLCLPFLQTMTFRWGDEGVLLNGAERLLDGDRLYSDFFEFLPPGGFLIVAGWFKIAGISLISARSLVILNMSGIAGLIFLCCRAVSRGTILPVILSILWVVMSQGLWTQVNHHWITTLFSMLVLYATLSNTAGKKIWPGLAGLAAGAAMMVTPTRGVLAGIAGLVALVYARRPSPWSGFWVYVIASVSIPFFIMVFMLAEGIFTAGFYDIIVFTGTRYAGFQYVPFAAGWDVRDFALAILFPLAFALALIAAIFGKKRNEIDMKLHMCGVFGVAGFVGCFPRPDMAHIAFAAPLVCPLFARVLTLLAWDWRPKYRVAAGVYALGVCAPGTVAFTSAAIFVQRIKSDSSPRGDVKFITPEGEAEITRRVVALPAGERVFFYPFLPTVSFLTARRQVSRYDVFAPGYNLPAQFLETCLSVFQEATWVVIDRGLQTPDDWKAMFPAMKNPAPRELAVFEWALNVGFRFAAREGRYELRHRDKREDGTLCKGIAD